MTGKQFFGRFWFAFSTGFTVGGLILLAHSLLHLEKITMYDMRMVGCVAFVSAVCAVASALLFWRRMSRLQIWLRRIVLMVITICSSWLSLWLIYGGSLAARMHVIPKAAAAMLIFCVPLYLLVDWLDRRRIARINEKLAEMQERKE